MTQLNFSIHNCKAAQPLSSETKSINKKPKNIREKKSHTIVLYKENYNYQFKKYFELFVVYLRDMSMPSSFRFTYCA